MGIGQPGPAAADGVGDRRDGVVLADDPLVEVLLEVDQLGRLGLHQPAHRHAGPLRHDLGDVLGVDLLLEHPVLALQLVEVLGGRGDALLQLRDPPVADLGGDVEVGLPLELGAQLLELLLERADGGDRLLLRLPMPLHRGDLGVEHGQLVAQRLQPRLAAASSLSFSRATCSISSCRMRRSTTSISVGIESISMRSLLAASSTRSIALSGRKRLVR